MNQNRDSEFRNSKFEIRKNPIPRIFSMRAKSNCHFTRDPKIFRKVPIYIKMSEPNLFVKFPNRGYIIQHLHTNVHRESQIQIVAGRKKMSWKSTEISKSGFLRPFFCQLSWNWRFKVVADIIGDRWQWWWRNGCVLAYTGCSPGFDSAEIVYMQREQMHAQRARCVHAKEGRDSNPCLLEPFLSCCRLTSVHKRRKFNTLKICRY